MLVKASIFFYMLYKAHAIENKLRLYGKNWPTLLSQSNSVRHLLPFALFVVSLLPVLTRDRKIVEHPLKNYDKVKKYLDCSKPISCYLLYCKKNFLLLSNHFFFILYNIKLIPISLFRFSLFIFIFRLEHLFFIDIFHLRKK